MRSLLLLVVTLLALAISCQQESTIPITNTSWVLVATVSGDIQEPASQYPPFTLVFSDSGTLQGNTGCNSYNGDYARDGSSFQLTELSMTEAGCPTPSFSNENRSTKA